MREPSVSYILTQNSDIYLAVDLPDREDTLLVCIDKERGYPSFNGLFGIDIFPSKLEAIEYIKMKSSAIKQITKYYMVCGLFHIKNIVVLCFVSKVRLIGQLFKKHHIFEVNGLSFVIVNNTNIQSDEQKLFSLIKSRRYHKQFILCHTYDISRPIQCDERHCCNCIWNRFMSQPFDFIKCGKICPNLIQGSFADTSFDRFQLYHIMRVSCETCQPLSCCRGTNGKGELGNCASVECIIAVEKGESYEIRSEVLLRGTTPITFQNQNKNMPDQIPHSSLPVLIHKVFEKYDVHGMNIIDCGNSSSPYSSQISRALQNTVNFAKENFIVNLYSFDWGLKRKELSFQKCIVAFKTIADEVSNDCDYTFCYIDRDKFTFAKKQKKVALITSFNGLDKANIGLFIVLMRFINKIIIDLKIDSVFHTTIICFLAAASINSGDLIAYASVGTESISHNDINASVSTDVAKRSESQDTSHIKSMRFKSFSDEQEIANGILFGTNQKLISNSTYFPVSSNTRCVSRAPHAYVISPVCASQIINKKRLTLTKKDGPILLVLSEPCYINEIVLYIPSQDEHLLAPSSFSIHGGPYANRTFPIFEDLAITSGEGITRLSYRRREDPHYSHEPIEHNLCPVRFVYIYFDSPFQSFVIDGIEIFGTTEQSSPVKQNPKQIIALPQLLNGAEFWENQSHETSIHWEERRLCALIPLKDYLFQIACKGINPGAVLSEYIFKLGKSKIPEDRDDIRCSQCRRKASFICGLCQQPFCLQCSEAKDSHDQVSDPDKKSKLCNRCYERRLKLSSSVARLCSLKQRMSTELYPFLLTKEAEFFSDSPIVVHQLTYGKNQVTVERIINNKDNSNDIVWCPEETMSRLEIVFKQNVHIKSIIVRCETDVNILAGDHQVYQFSAPGNAYPIDFSSRFLSLLIYGDNIRINSISFGTEAIPETITLNERKAEQLVKKFQHEVYFANPYMIYKVVPRAEIRQQIIYIAANTKVMDSTEPLSASPCCGIEFSDMRHIKSIVIQMFSDESQHFLRYVFPQIAGTYNIFFPEIFLCTSLVIWYVECNEPFILPTVKPLFY